jgi:hypothetical protein
MRSIKVLGLCLVAVFAFSAVAAASAFAEEAPQFAKCVKAGTEEVEWKETVGGKEKTEKKKVDTGAYSNKECSVPNTGNTYRSKGAHPEAKGEGKYEAEALKERGAGVSFAVKSKETKITTHGVAGHSQAIVCKDDKWAGEIYNHNGAGKLQGVFTFEKCKSGTEKCGNVGPETIEYKSGPSESLWGATGETEPRLLSVGGPTFKCGAEEVQIGETLVGALADTSKGLVVSWAVKAGTQEDQTFFTEGEEYTGVHWSSTPGEVETTVAGEEGGIKGVYVVK